MPGLCFEDLLKCHISLSFTPKFSFFRAETVLLSFVNLKPSAQCLSCGKCSITTSWRNELISGLSQLALVKSLVEPLSQAESGVETYSTSLVITLPVESNPFSQRTLAQPFNQQTVSSSNPNTSLIRGDFTSTMADTWFLASPLPWLTRNSSNMGNELSLG